MSLDDETEDVLIKRTNQFKWALPIGATILSAVGGLLFGYDTGVISGAMIEIRRQFSLSYFYQEVIISITLVAAAVAALCSAGLTDWLGRKPVILLASIIFTVGAIVLGVAKNKETLLIGRLIVGLGIGMASMTVPVYIAEIAPSHLRGRLVTLNTVSITAGQFIAGIVDGVFISDSVNGWRYMLALGGIPSMIQLIGFLAMPETPRWLVEKGRITEARDVLRRTHGEREATSVVENELQRILEASKSYSGTSMETSYDQHSNSRAYLPLVDSQPNESSSLDTTSSSSIDETSLSGNPITTSTSSSYPRGVKEWFNRLTIVRVLRYPPTRRAFFVSCTIQLFQQLVGINTVMYYSASIISMSGIGARSTTQNRESTVVWIAAVVAFANFAFCAISPWLISRFRRRTLLLCSLSGVIFSLIFLGIGFQLIASFSSPITIVEPTPVTPIKFAESRDCYLAQTCDECMRSTMCGFCYSFDQFDSSRVVNGSCLPSAGEFAGHSAYGRCSNMTTSSTDLIWAYDHCPTRFGWMTLVGLLLYLASFSPGMAPLPWTIISEMFPTWARSTGVAGGATSNWIANIVVSLTFLTLTEAITRQGTYFMYAGISILALLFVYKCVPETGDAALEDIQMQQQQREDISNKREGPNRN